MGVVLLAVSWKEVVASLSKRQNVFVEHSDGKEGVGKDGSLKTFSYDRGNFVSLSWNCAHERVQN